MEKLILFVCVESACRSQMAKVIFNKLAPKGWKAISARTKPAKSINSKVVRVLKEVGIDINEQKSKQLTADMIKKANKIITMGCEADFCPMSPGKTEDWGIENPSGKSIEKFREIRDKIRDKVEDLIKEYKRK